MPTISDSSSPLNVTLVQGADFGPATLTFTNPDGSAINLTGASVAAAMRKSFTTAVVATFTTTITNATAGQVALGMPATEIAGLTPGVNASDPGGQYVWDFKLTASNGTISRPLAGIVTLLASVTP